MPEVEKKEREPEGTEIVAFLFRIFKESLFIAALMVAHFCLHWLAVKLHVDKETWLLSILDFVSQLAVMSIKVLFGSEFLILTITCAWAVIQAAIHLVKSIKGEVKS